MNFGEALQALKEGKKVSRSVWGGYWYLVKNITFSHDPLEIKHSKDSPAGKLIGGEMSQLIIAQLKDGGSAAAMPYQEDLLAEDWHIVD